MQPETDDADIVRDWWRGLDHGERARLRRCQSPTDALMLRGTLALVRALGWQRWPERAGALAVVLANIKRDTDQSLMRALGNSKWMADDARLSRVRFEQLARVRTIPELMTELVRLIRLADETASIADITEALKWGWNDRTRRTWAAAYYAANISTNGESDD